MWSGGVRGVVVFFFFSSRRRHTRSLRDWSSDVCSSDLLASGRVLVALLGTEVIGHLQLVETDRPGEVEIKNMAVREDHQGRGVGGRLVRAATELVTAESGSALLVATAAADIDNLRFYQRHGFRMRAIERDAFTPASGYPPGIRINGIGLRDRVWLDHQLSDRPEPADGPRRPGRPSST